jgi:hypothetical protein
MDAADAMPMSNTLGARCPRCGYDQRGEMSTWSDACPLESRCAECGLLIDWRQLLNPSMMRPCWGVEYAASIWSFSLRSVATHLLVFLPSIFWTSLKMIHPLQRGRLLLHAGLPILLVYLLFAVGQALIVHHVWTETRFGWYATAPLLADDEALLVFLLPLSNDAPLHARKLLNADGTTRTIIYPMISPWWLLRERWIPALRIVPYFALMHALLPLGFAALPTSRRIAKVRWGHIARIALYGISLGLPALCFGIVGLALRESSRNVLGDIGGGLYGIAFVLAVLFIPLEFIWWRAATERYLQMDHPWAICTAIFVMAAIGALLVVTIIFIVGVALGIVAA